MCAGPGPGQAQVGAAPFPLPRGAQEAWARPPRPTALLWTIAPWGANTPKSLETLLGWGRSPGVGPWQIQLQPWAPGNLVGYWKLTRPAPHPHSPHPWDLGLSLRVSPAGTTWPTCSRACQAPPKHQTTVSPELPTPHAPG